MYALLFTLFSVDNTFTATADANTTSVRVKEMQRSAAVAAIGRGHIDIVKWILESDDDYMDDPDELAKYAHIYPFLRVTIFVVLHQSGCYFTRQRTMDNLRLPGI